MIFLIIYLIGIVGLIRFMQAVHQWDEDIEEMEKKKGK
jgi:hypothetical protein